MKKNIYILIILVIGIFIFDFLTKIIIDNNMSLMESNTIINDFLYITYVHNKGGAWSIMSGQMFFFYAVTIISLVVFIYLSRSVDFKNKKIYSISIGLLIGGTLGNFYDRIIYGYVIDFLDFKLFGYNFPVFNIADISLVSGIIGLIIYYYFLEEEAVNE